MHNIDYNYFKDKNLLVISPRFPPREGFPRNVFVKEQVDELKKYFNRVVVIATSPYIPKFISKFMQPRRRHEALMEDYLYDNVEVYYTKDIVLPFDFHKRKWGDIAYKKGLKILEKIKFKPDIIHAHFTWPSGYAAVNLSKKFNVPLIITAHGYDVYDLPFRSKEWFRKVKFVLDSADHIITVSRSNLNILVTKLNIPKDKISIIPNGFDSNLFRPMDKATARKQLNLPEDKKIILNVANLVPVKGHSYLIEAIGKVVRYRKDIMLIIVGDGPLRKELENQIKKLNLENYVKLVGFKPHDEIPFWMNAADLFVLPSLSESFGIVQIEAMACGVPVVATRNGGSEEIIISEDHGFLCPPKDPECLAEKILDALKKNWGKEKIKKYAEQFTWERVVNKIIELYFNILKCNDY